ncbi:MAG: sulfurtransferase TusA family protein [Nitrososphaerales archaeon]
MLSEEKVIFGEDSLRLSKADKVIDVKGMVCPYPSFETVKALASMNSGEVLEVITDSKISALESIPTLLKRKNYEFIVIQKDKELWQIKVRKA